MKILEVYVRNDWLAVNTDSHQFRGRTLKDILSVSQKTLKAAPVLAIASAGMSKGMATQGVSLTNIGMHVIREAHTGIGNVGKNNGRFYNEIDMLRQKKFAGFASAHPELPVSKMWLVINDDQNSKDEIDKGVLFYSNTEAKRFAQMYPSIENYIQSEFYKHKGISIQITENDLETFDEELIDYLEARNKSFLTSILNRADLRNEHFIESSVGEDLEDEMASSIIQIDFPEAVSERDFKKYFPRTDLASTCLEMTIAAIQLEKAAREAKEPKFESTKIYEEMAQKAALSPSDDEKEYGDEKELEEYEELTLKGKEKPKIYTKSDKEPVDGTAGTTQDKPFDADIRTQASDRLTKQRTITSPGMGMFKSIEEVGKKTKDEEDDDLSQSNSSQPY